MTNSSLKINSDAIMKVVESPYIKSDLANFSVGDTVKFLK